MFCPHRFRPAIFRDCYRSWVDESLVESTNMTHNFADVIRRKLESDPALAAAVEQERFNGELARSIRELRTVAGLTQAQLAERIGARQPQIARLENGDYDGHSLKMIGRIAKALGK